MKFLTLPEKNLQLTFETRGKMNGVQGVEVLLNGHIIDRLSAKDIEKCRLVTLNLPEKYLKIRVNEIEFRVARAGMPVAYNINSDTRMLGVNITLPKLSVLEK